jgi:hypothetical protein
MLVQAQPSKNEVLNQEDGIYSHIFLLASQISRDDCQRLGLEYLDPREIDVTQWQTREDEGILFVPEAGENLYMLRRV